jgi:hypothetical protein
MLPDIAGRGPSLDRVDMNTVQVLNNNKINGGNMSARNESKNGGGYSADKPLIVPLLSLPGGLVSSASIVSPANGNHKQQVSSSRLPTDINGSSNEYSNGSESGRDAKKSKPTKSKIPKMPTGGGKAEQSGGSYQQQAQQNTVKMPSLTGNNNNNNNGYNQLASGRASAEMASKAQAAFQIDEQGTGEHAGPLDDWGFLQDDLALGGSKHLDGAPELEYSDDEDFESSEARGKQNQSGNSKSKGNKKKKKKHAYDDGGDSKHNDKVTPRQQFSLPPI